MSYLVLARKSRPQTFAEVVGQRSVVKTLQNSIRRERVAHAILFSGVRGVGKTTLARIMAKGLNCQADLEARPCGQCDACREIASGSSLDLHEIDGASNRGIHEIRELKEKIRFLPSSARYKVIIIDEVHMLTTEAFNALLKTLEEPPAHVHFMFATTELHKIPITILSRCQQYELKRVPAKELYDHFMKLATEEGFTIEPAALSLIVRESGGSVRDGLSLLDQMFSFGETNITSRDVVEVLGLVGRDVLMNLAEGLIRGDRKLVFSGINEVFTYGMDVRRFMDDLMEQFRNLLLCRIDGTAELVDMPEEELNQLRELASSCSYETIHLILHMLMEAAEDLRHSGQPRISLETSLLKIIETGNVVPVSALLGHLEEIISGLGDAPLPQALQNPSANRTQPLQQNTPSAPAGPSGNIPARQAEHARATTPVPPSTSNSYPNYQGNTGVGSMSEKKKIISDTEELNPTNEAWIQQPADEQQATAHQTGTTDRADQNESVAPATTEQQDTPQESPTSPQILSVPAASVSTTSIPGMSVPTASGPTETAVSPSPRAPEPLKATQSSPDAAEYEANDEEDEYAEYDSFSDEQFTQPANQPPKIILLNPHVKDTRRYWLEFIDYVKKNTVWMAQDLARADTVREEVSGELNITYHDAANCSLLRRKENVNILTEFALDFFQKPLKIRFIVPDVSDEGEDTETESPHRKRQQLANDPLVIMAAEIFNGEIGDIRIGRRSR